MGVGGMAGFVSGVVCGGVRRRTVVCAIEDRKVAVEEDSGRGRLNVEGIRRVAKVDAVGQAGFDDEEARELTRLYSTVGEDEGLKSYVPSSMFGAIALIAGTTIGAGILALPAVTKDGGFIPSTGLLVGAWVYMAVTGNLIAEATVATMYSTGRSNVSLLSMVELTLGKAGALASGSAYVFIHYALLVAYIAQGGKVVGEIFHTYSPATWPWISQVLFPSAIGALMYFGGTKVVEKTNNTLVVTLLGTFALLISSVVPNLDLGNFAHIDVPEALKAVPVMILALVYHNIVPVVCSQMDGDLKRVSTAINVGSAIPAVMFLTWNAAILGTVAPGAAGVDPVEIVRQGGSNMGQLVSVFSLLAITTSMFGFVYGLFDFIRDAGQRVQQSPEEPGSGETELPMYFATFIPPTICAMVAPGIFFKALDSAGTYGITVLFGIIPAAMVWKLRYADDSAVTSPMGPLVAGGRWTLALIAGGAATLIATNVLEAVMSVAAG